jgi:hypothetical protein
MTSPHDSLAPACRCLLFFIALAVAVACSLALAVAVACSFALAFAVACSFALAFALACSFVVIPQRSGGICFSHLPLPLLLR